MRIRHRIPSIFNLSMVDVLCCALGCVIMLWLVHQREARLKARDADIARRAALTLKTEAEASKQEIDSSSKRLKQTQDELRAVVAELAKLRAHAGELNRQLESARTKNANLEKAKATVEDRLAKEIAEKSELENRFAAALERVEVLGSQLKERTAEAGAFTRRAEEMSFQLSKTQAKNQELQALADLVPALRKDIEKLRDRLAKEEALARALEKEVGKRTAELGDRTAKLEKLDKELAAAHVYRDKLAIAEQRAQALERDLERSKKELADAGRTLTQLRGEKKVLATEAARMRTAAENRFAGIALTGKRVVFLVDMSGSMDLVDERTVAPDKWAGVRDTLARIMRSLPELEKFQVVMFSEKASYLLGSEGQWLDYDPKTSVDRVARALAAIKPRGGTNLYAALETAFRFRPLGLDTIYLFSDGLPNMGEGLSLEQARTMKEFEQAEILSKHIHKTLKTNWNREIKGKPKVRINAVGFFYESSHLGSFLWQLARENDGSFVGMSKP